MSWIDTFLQSLNLVQSGGASLPQRPTLNFVGASVTDDEAHNSTTVVVSGGLQIVDITTVGGDGNGIADNTAAMALAIAALAPNGVVYFPPGLFRFLSTQSWDANVWFGHGGAITVDALQTVTIEGSVDANEYQHIFQGAGTVVLLTASRVPVPWYGADLTGVADNAALLQQVIDTSPGTIGAARTIYFPVAVAGGYYKSLKPLVLHPNYTKLAGESAYGSVIRCDSVHGTLVLLSHPDNYPSVVSSITGTGNSMVYATGGATDQYFDLRDITYLADLPSFTALTIECTFQNDATVAGGDTRFVSSSSGGFAPGGFFESIDIDLTPGSDANHSDLTFYLNTATGGGDLTVNDAVVKGAPLHVSCVWDGTTMYLFYGTPGGTTSHVTKAAGGALQTTFGEGLWIGGGYSTTWPENSRAFNKFTGELDCFRISNFARNTTDFTAPVGKLPTDDTHNLNVGGAGKNTYYLTNFDTYLAAWVGYSWAAGAAQNSYIGNRKDDSNLGAVVNSTVEKLTIQSGLGRALQCIRAVGCFFDELELYGTYGLTFEGDSFYSEIGTVNCHSTGPALSGVRKPYCVAGYLNPSSDVLCNSLGIFDSFAIGAKIGGGGTYDFIKLVPNGYCIVPLFYAATGSFSLGTFSFISVDDENVGLFPTYPTSRGNWQTCLYLESINTVSFRDCEISVANSGDIPCVTGNAVFDSGLLSGVISFDSCLFTGSVEGGATSPTFSLTGPGGNLPVVPIRITNSVNGNANGYSSAAQAQYFSLDSGVRWANPQESTWGPPDSQIASDLPTEVVTTSTAPTVAFSYAMPDLTTIEMDVLVVANNEDTTTDGARWSLSAAYKRNGSTPAIMGSLDKTGKGTNSGSPPAGWDATITTSGNNVEVVVTGPSSDHVKFQVVAQTITVT